MVGINRSALRDTGSTHQWRKIRAAILRRDNYTCQLCGFEEATHVDHIVERRNGGTDIPENLRALCAKCNLSRKRNKGAFFKNAATPKTPLALFLPENAQISHYQG